MKFQSIREQIAGRLGLAVVVISFVCWMGCRPARKPAGEKVANSSPTDTLVAYGRELVAHTSLYLGLEGSISRSTNGMNCQNCHLEAGTKPYGNNYFAVASTYPKFRNRSGTVESVEKRVNDCIERSLNGEPLAQGSRELKAFVAYIKSVGKEYDVEPPGTGLPSLPFLDRAADPGRGRVVFEKHCVICHGNSGGGQRVEGQREWTYPPLWGDGSYNVGAGLFRISRFAAFVRYNMPLGVSYDSAVLTNEEAWDVAAFVNSMSRPARDLSGDWPDLATKPLDHPFGSYADPFSEKQHKYGPYTEIEAFYKGKGL